MSGRRTGYYILTEHGKKAFESKEIERKIIDFSLKIFSVYFWWVDGNNPVSEFN